LSFVLYSNGKKIEDKISFQELIAEEVGIFESLRTYGDKIFREAEHLKRFMHSAKTAGVQVPEKTLLSRELNLALKAFSREDRPRHDLFVRLTLWRKQIVVMVGTRKHAESIYKTGVRLKTSPVKRTHSNASPAEIKTTAYQNSVLASLEPMDSKTYEWVFLDLNGYVTEVRIGNLFIVKAGALYTPPEPGILNGVTRRFVIECATWKKIPVSEVPLMRHDVFNADEAFLTNTSWEILPVCELDLRRIGQSLPGPITVKLQNAFKQKVKHECL